jgi:hypothetical protein
MKNEETNTANEAPRTFTIPEVEIFRAGTWTDSAGRAVTYAPEDIEGMAAAHAELAERLEPPGKLGHDPEQPLLRTDGLPAAGWLRNVRAAGGRLFADLAGVPKKIYDLLLAGAYRKRSLEVLHNYRDEATGRVYPHVAAGLALLGARLPAIGSLSDIRALYENESGAAYFYEAGPDGIAVVAEEQPEEQPEEPPAPPAAEDGGLDEKIAALEARISELEAALAASAVEEEAVPDAVVVIVESAEPEETPALEGEADQTPILVADESVSDESDAPIEGTPIDMSEVEDGPVVDNTEIIAPEEAAAIVEMPAEEPELADEETNEAADTASEDAASADESTAAISEKEAALEELASKLRAALDELEGWRRGADDARARERREFASKYARKVPPAFRAVVLDVMALLDGDMPSLSEYRLGEGDAMLDTARAFRGFVAALQDHPAMSEYGREAGCAAAGCGCRGDGAGEFKGSETEMRIRAYCAERGLDPADASDYASAAIAVLEYERPPTPDEKASGAGASAASEGFLNSNFSAGVSPCQEGADEYTDRKKRDEGKHGCECCGDASNAMEKSDGIGSSYRWWKNIERAVKNEKEKILDKATKFATREVIRGFAMELKEIDDRYKECMGYVKRGREKESVCNSNAVSEVRQVVDRYMQMADERYRSMKYWITSQTSYSEMKSAIKVMMNRFANEHADYFDFL